MSFFSRAVKDKVERVIAEKIISGEVRTGVTVELTAEDLAQYEPAGVPPPLSRGED
ncbi:MAG: hypothetical protein HYT94_00705 [Parcubacteria group bacterium]|nr:hypothetical protein [Parcubacteria group bacterium]